MEMTPKIGNLTVFTDPGHGWLRVPHESIERFEIGSKISSYSYRDDDYAYLEEDCDLSIYAEAFCKHYKIGKNLFIQSLENKHTEGQIWIRHLKSY